MPDDKNSPLPDGFDWRMITPDDSPKGLPDVMSEQTHLSTADLAASRPVALVFGSYT